MLLGANATQKLTSLLILVMLAMMWNALAGYGGLVSVGQQAFIGIGAYGTIYLVDQGVTPYLAMFLSAARLGRDRPPVSVLMLRLRAAQFAIGMWVVAESFALLVTLDQSLGGGTGTSLIELNAFTPHDRQEYTYWLTLGVRDRSCWCCSSCCCGAASARRCRRSATTSRPRRPSACA